MKLTYDQDRQFEATTGFVLALEALAREYLKMMREADEPQYRDCWAFCDVVIGDTADASFIEFLSGGIVDKPKGMTGDVRIRVREKR
jgi:hypothetical protein